MAVIKKGPDGSGSMGGHDPEKYGPIRSLLKYYAKKPKIFTACVRDNRKRFGPRVNAVCAWVKDQIKGTTKWRGKEAELRAELGLEGLTEAEIDMFIFDMDTMESIVFPPSQAEAVKFCEANGIDYDIHGFDEPCPDCGDWGDCGCVALQEAVRRHKLEVEKKHMILRSSANNNASLIYDGGLNNGGFLNGGFLNGGFVESSAVQAKPIHPSRATQAENKEFLDSDKKDLDEALAGTPASASSSSGGSKSSSGNVDPREIARPENGTIVYDDGSIKDTKTGLTRFPSVVFPDGSIRYDDGSVARPGSLASMLVMRPLTKEDRAMLAERGAQGMPIGDFASVEDLMSDLAKQTYGTSGKGGAGELAIDGLMQKEQLAAGLNDGDKANLMAAKPSPQSDLSNARKTSDPNKPSMGKEYDTPLRPRRGEKVQRGPRGGRGVWRNVDGRNIFIKIGQTPREARREQTEEDNKKK